jgi:hypothetical protein
MSTIKPDIDSSIVHLIPLCNFYLFGARLKTYPAIGHLILKGVSPCYDEHRGINN